MLDKTKAVRKELCQGKNSFKKGDINYGSFLASKKNYCLTIDKYGVIQEHKTL